MNKEIEFIIKRKSIEVQKAREKKEWRTEYMTLEYKFREKVREGETKKLLDLIVRKIQKQKSIDVIADELEEDPRIIEEMYNVAIKYAPDYDLDDIYIELNK